jgi:hypothetical protein
MGLHADAPFQSPCRLLSTVQGIRSAGRKSPEAPPEQKNILQLMPPLASAQSLQFTDAWGGSHGGRGTASQSDTHDMGQGSTPCMRRARPILGVLYPQSLCRYRGGEGEHKPNKRYLLRKNLWNEWATNLGTQLGGDGPHHTQSVWEW